MGGFWAEVGGQVGAQIDPKSIKKAIQNQMHFVIDFLIDLGGVKQKKIRGLTLPERMGGGQCYLLIDHRGRSVVVRE